MLRVLLLPVVAILVACEAAAAKTPARPQPSFSIPYSIVLAPSGALFIADGGSGRVLRSDPARKRVTVDARGLREPVALARAPDGTLYVPDVARGCCAWIDAGGRRCWRQLHLARRRHHTRNARVAGDGTPESTR